MFNINCPTTNSPIVVGQHNEIEGISYWAINLGSYDGKL